MQNLKVYYIHVSLTHFIYYWNNYNIGIVIQYGHVISARIFTFKVCSKSCKILSAIFKRYDAGVYVVLSV